MKVGHILVCQRGEFGHMDLFLGNHHSFKKKLTDDSPVLCRFSITVAAASEEAGMEGAWATAASPATFSNQFI